jgi:hypothetical protein
MGGIEVYHPDSVKSAAQGMAARRPLAWFPPYAIMDFQPTYYSKAIIESSNGIGGCKPVSKTRRLTPR